MVSRLPTASAGLLALAALTLAIASLIHFGVRVPLGAITMEDPFAGAAPPVAVLAAVVAAGALSETTGRAAAGRPWSPRCSRSPG